MSDGPTTEERDVAQCRSMLRAALAAFSRVTLNDATQALREDAADFEFGVRSAPASFIEALDLAGAAALCLNDKKEVIGDTARARAFYDDDFHVVGRRVHLRSDSDRKALQDLFDAAQSNAPRRSMVIRSACRPTGILASLISAPRSGRDAPVSALLLLHDLAGFQQPDAAVLASVFELTPAEAETAALLASGHSVDAIANLRRVSRETVRTALKSIFAKTCTARQSELVLLLSRFARL